MQILAHRGLWNKNEEKNRLDVLKKALEKGYGIETDIRDYEGELVISHNIAEANSPKLESLLEYYHDIRCKEILALNVKSDGIQEKLTELLNKYSIHNYFLFDMSVPEMVVYRERKLAYYTRHSDIERECVLYGDSDGVWLDSFYDYSWLTEDDIMMHLNDGKKVCLVSPELHGRDYYEMWFMLKTTGLYLNDELQICTDKVEECKVYFYGEN